MAAKRQVRKQKKSGAKRSARQESVKQKVLDRVRSTGEWSDYEMMTDIPDIEKMSEVILKFAEPLTEAAEDDDDDEAYKKAVGIAIMVWNSTLLPKDEQDRFLKELLEGVSQSSAEDYAIGLEMVDLLLKRKRRYFKNIIRYVIDFEIRFTKNNRQLYVASTTQLPTKRGRLPYPTPIKPWWKRILWWK